MFLCLISLYRPFNWCLLRRKLAAENTVSDPALGLDCRHNSLFKTALPQQIINVIKLRYFAELYIESG